MHGLRETQRTGLARKIIKLSLCYNIVYYYNGAQRLLSELPDKDWKPGSINSLLKRICKTGTIVQQPGSGRPRLSHSSGEDLVLSQEDKPSSIVV